MYDGLNSVHFPTSFTLFVLAVGTTAAHSTAICGACLNGGARRIRTPGSKLNMDDEDDGGGDDGGDDEDDAADDDDDHHEIVMVMLRRRGKEEEEEGGGVKREEGGGGGGRKKANTMMAADGDDEDEDDQERQPNRNARFPRNITREWKMMSGVYTRMWTTSHTASSTNT